MKKSDVFEWIRAMPEDIDPDTLNYTLWLRRTVELAEAEDEKDNIPHDEMERLSEERRG
jgi:hypothetical protein